MVSKTGSWLRWEEKNNDRDQGRDIECVGAYGDRYAEAHVPITRSTMLNLPQHDSVIQ